jgi:hypothetical protein
MAELLNLTHATLKVSDQCGVSFVRPEPVDHSSAGVSSLIKTRSPLSPEQFQAGLAGGFSDILQQGTSKLSQLRYNSSGE